MDISTLLETTIDNSYKGIPGSCDPFQLKDIHKHGWNLLKEDLPSPLLTVTNEALQHNLTWMQQFADMHKIKLCPHGKTTMAPQIFKQQLTAGAWGMTAANAAECQIYRRFGINRILLANQLACKQDIRYITQEINRDPEFDFYCLTDSIEHLAIITQEFTNTKPLRPLQLLIEIGTLGGRTGCRTLEQTIEVAQYIQKHPQYFSLVGIEGYEGVIASKATPESVAKVTTYLHGLLDITNALLEKELLPKDGLIISAGGSAFFDLVASIIGQTQLTTKHTTLLRAGCYVVHDSDWYAQFFAAIKGRSPELLPPGKGLQPALTIWGSIISLPEPSMAILNFGKRDCPYDISLPIAEKWFRPEKMDRTEKLGPSHKITGLYDQHALLAIPEGSPLRVGDVVGCGISHPCGAFDRWQLIPLLDEKYNVIDAIHTFF